MIRSDFTVAQLLFVDETSKDLRSIRRGFGYSLRGEPAVGTSGLMPRGPRVSALCSFDYFGGFRAWACTQGTYNTDRFLTAAQRVVVRSRSRPTAHLLAYCGPRAPHALPRLLPNPPPPSARPWQLDQVQCFPLPRSVVVLDNASIHRSFAFVHACNLRGAIVLYTPPYCWNLTPLDNGAFGLVKKWLQHHERSIIHHSLTITQALDMAFTYAVTPDGARHCFHKCGYW